MAEFMYSRRFYNNPLIRRMIRLSRKAVDIRDALTDKRICGRSLSEFVPAVAAGATGSQSTPYSVLDTVFKNAKISEDNAFLDIGCGKGRVLAFLIKKKAPCPLTGIELNPEVAAVAQAWTQRYPNAAVICGDVFDIDLNRYDVFFMSRPFEPDLFSRFLQKLEREVHHRITLYYWVDQQSGALLHNRTGWIMHERKILFFRRGFFIAMTPQQYSVWTYLPHEA